MIRTMVEQILGTIPNKEVYPDHYIVGEHGEYNMIVLKDNDGIKGFSLYIPQEKENDMSKEKKEMFEKEYPAKEVATNPFTACEAIGYLKHLKVSNPEQAAWIDKRISSILTVSTMLMLSLK